MKRIFDPCRRYRRDLCLLAAGALPETEGKAVENHLATCADCRKYYNELRTVAAPLANWEENFAHLQPSPLTQRHWARAIETAGASRPVHRLTPAKTFRDWWREVIWPWRRVWAGLAMTWVIILAGNVSLHAHSQFLAAKSLPGSKEMILSFKDQQKILAELLSGPSTSLDVDRQKFFSPKPRTERAEILMV